MDQRRDATDVGGMSDTRNMRPTAAVLTPQQMRELAEDATAAAVASSTHPVDRVQSCRYAAALRTAAAEVDRLRATIENAPHDLTKQHAWYGLDMTLCRCWKADAL